MCHYHLTAQPELGCKSVNCSLGAVRSGGEASLVLGPLPVLSEWYTETVSTQKRTSQGVAIDYHSVQWSLVPALCWVMNALRNLGKNWRCPPIRCQICAQLHVPPSLSWCRLLLRKCNRYTEIQFMYHTTHLLKVLNSLIFIRVAELGSHQARIDFKKKFHHAGRSPVPVSHHSHFPIFHSLPHGTATFCLYWSTCSGHLHNLNHMWHFVTDLFHLVFYFLCL